MTFDRSIPPRNNHITSELQIRGSKGYFSIIFCFKKSALNTKLMPDEKRDPLQFEVSALLFKLCVEIFILSIKKRYTSIV